MKLTRILKMLLVLALSTSITSCDEFFASFDNPVPKVDPETPPEPDPNPEPTYASDFERPLTFKAAQDNVKVTFMFSSDAKPDFKKVEYSLDQGATWTPLSSPNQAILLKKEGDIVMFRGENPTYNGDARFVIETAASNARRITRKLEMSDKLAAAIGNIYSLIFGKNISGSIKLTAENANAFKNLLKDCPIDAVSDEGNMLVLTAQTLAESCYDNMFAGCAEMTKAPELPAPTLVKGCYSNMFKDCSNLGSVKLDIGGVAEGVTLEQAIGGMLGGTTGTNAEGGLRMVMNLHVGEVWDEVHQTWHPGTAAYYVPTITVDDVMNVSGISAEVLKNTTVSLVNSETGMESHPVDYVPVTGMDIRYDFKIITALSVTQGDEFQLDAIISPENATDKSVSWTSNNDDIVFIRVNPPTSNTTVSYVNAIAPGTVTITASHGSISASVEITVKSKEPETISVIGVTLDKTTLSLETGGTATLKATVAPTDATDQTVTWSSDKESVATVDSDGKVTAVAAGEATITVTTKDGSKTATCKVTVTEPEPENPVIDSTDDYEDGGDPLK